MRYFLAVILLLFSCHTKLPNSVGRTREIMVITEPDTINTLLSQAIQITYYTPRIEKKYHFLEVDIEKFDQAMRFHMIILANPLDESKTGKIISNFLSPEAEEAVLKNGFGIFQLKDQWASPQTIIIISSRNDSALISGINKNASQIRKLINQHYHDRISYETFLIGEDKKLEQYLAENYHYQLRIPEGYWLEERYAEEDFIYLHRHRPDRSIFIAQISNRDTITIDWLLDKRDILTLLYYEGDYSYRDLCFGGWMELGNKKVFKIYGVWQNDSLIAGGPFILYCFPYQEYCCIVDGMVFVPGKRKITYLTSLEAIVSSFKYLDTLALPSKISK